MSIIVQAFINCMPKAYDALAWQHNLDEMHHKAKITNEQKN